MRNSRTNHGYKVAFAALLLIAAGSVKATAAETVIIEDDFTTGKTAGLRRGGIFTEEGYQPTTINGHILYQLTNKLKNGYAEFVFKGMNKNALPKGGDQGFLGMYDGRGIVEPVKYLPEFKENFFRWNVQFRKDKGIMKAVISCASQKRAAEPYAVYEDGDRDWSKEPLGKPQSWDPKRWYTMKVDWHNKAFRVYVDGVLKWSSNGPLDYSPEDHRIWLGCAPGVGTKYRNLIPTLVYKSFKLVSYDTTEE